MTLGEVVTVAFSNKDLMFLEFNLLIEANCVLEMGCRNLRGGVLDLETWRVQIEGALRKKTL